MTTGTLGTLFVAPSEPAKLRELGEVSMLPEERGVDFLWRAQGRWWGFQRKELKDLMASLNDGRLRVDIAKMKGNVECPMIVVEGTISFTTEGELILGGPWGQRWTVQQWDGLLLSIAHSGVALTWVRTQDETRKWIATYRRWSDKEKHTSLLQRPGPNGDSWGRLGNRDYGIHLLSGLPNVGPELAGRIYDAFGTVPWEWTIGYMDLLSIRGIGKDRAIKLIEALEGGTVTIEGTET